MQELWSIIMCVAFSFWLVVTIGFALWFWFRMMPVVRELRKTSEGQRMLIKLIFPPRFRR